MSSFLSGEEFSKEKGLKLLCHNSRSISKKVWQYNLLFKNMDYICISETWLHPGIMDHQVDIDNMTVFRQDRDHTTQDIEEEVGGGVACYVSNKYAPFTQRLDHLCKVNKNIEVLTLATTSPIHKHKLLITTYRPPKGNVKEFYRELSEIICESNMADKEIWVCGDMNVDYKHRNSPKYKKALRFLRKNGLKHLPTGSTRLHPKGSTTIDHIYTNKGRYVASGNINEYLSDHIPIYAVFKKVRNNRLKKLITGRSYRNYNKDKLIEYMSRVVTAETLENMDADGLSVLLIETITSYLDEDCPVREFSIPEEEMPWVDDHILSMIKERHRALKLADQFNDIGINHQLKEARRLRQAIDKCGRNNMAKIIKGKLEMYKKNPKKFWEVLNKLWKGKRLAGFLSLIDDDTGVVIQQEDTASYVNEFFCTIGEKLAVDLVNNPGNHTRYEAIEQLQTEINQGVTNDDDLLAFDEINAQSLTYMVDDLNVEKASGIEDMRSTIIKDSMLGNIGIWTTLMNICITTSVFPDILKIGTIIALPKSGNLRSVLNWRPITLLPLIGKILEKVLHRQLMNHIDENGLMSKSQYGFLPNKSTAMAILQLVNILYSARNKGEYVMAAFLDIRKAFDVVHHGRLLMKMKGYGLSLGALKMIASYLESRKCSTLANDKRSPPMSVSYGVPQGSVLGPLLFLYYINDLPEMVKNTVPILYADDLVLLSIGKNPIQVKTLLQNDLTSVQHWCNINRLTPNIGKTKSMWFVPDNKVEHVRGLNVELNGQLLGQVVEFKYLGVWLDRDLKFDRQLENLDHQIALKLIQFRKTRHYLTVDGAMSIYKQAIVPIIEYCDFLVDSGPADRIRKLQTHQNNGLRICVRKKIGEMTTNQLHKKCNVERLDPRRRKHLACLMYRHASVEGNCIIQNNRTRADSKRKLKVERPKREKYRRGPLYRGMQIWSELDSDLQKQESVHQFKAKLQKVIK